MHQSLRLRCDGSALAGNYRQIQSIAGSAAGAAVKADGYGLGASETVRQLWQAGCRDFFVSTWWEAARLDFLPEGTLAVLHGLGSDDVPVPGVRPVLVSTEQIARWKEGAHRDHECDVMIDTGMNRLGLSLDELGAVDGLRLHTLHSHLACADEDSALNHQQLERFRGVRSSVTAIRYSLANSAGTLLGRDFAFDLVRPGLALYGGIPRPEAREWTKPVASLSAQVIQVRNVPAGETVGYNATFVAPQDLPLAILNIGYADGYWRAFSSRGSAMFDGRKLPVVGRVSMDLVAIDASAAPHVREGDWVDLDFDLESAAALTGYSQYELLTGLGRRLQRSWS